MAPTVRRTALAHGGHDLEAKLSSMRQKHDALVSRVAKLRREHKSAEVPLKALQLLKCKIIRAECRAEKLGKAA